MRNVLKAFAGLALVLLGHVELFAAPFVESIHPPALQRGTKERVVIRGTQLNQVVGVWSSSPGGVWQGRLVPGGTDQEVTVEIQVPSAAPLGIVGFRLATKSGLSNVSLVVVDELPIALKQPESNEPAPLTLPAVIAARCREAKADRYALTVTAGQEVSVDLIGSRLGKDFDPLVTVIDPQGKVVARRDNDQGLFFDVRFTHRFQSPGRHLIEVRDTRFEAQPNWNYLLRVGDFPAARVTLPSSVAPDQEATLSLPELNGREMRLLPLRKSSGADFFQELRLPNHQMGTWVALTASVAANQLESGSNHSLETASPVTVPANLHGVLSSPKEEDYFRFDLKKGDSLTFTGVARSLGSPADLELVLFDTAGKEVRRVDDITQQRNGINVTQEARFDFNVGQDGTYKLLVRDIAADGGPAFTYRIEVEKPQPVLELHSDYSAFVIPQASWQPLPITVTRTRIAGPIELSLVGAPDGITIEPSVIPADSNEFVAKLVAGKTAQPGVAAFQIVGKCVSSDGTQRAEAAVETRPMIDRQIKNKDRIPLALRDNQTQLPPSLPSCLALQVTPAVPFDIQIPFESLLVTKYVPTPIQIQTVRQGGFQSPIEFTVEGGQIGTEEEERDNIFLKLPPATGDSEVANGVFYNRILTRYERKRADLFARASVDGYQVTLIRHFDLDVRSAFRPTFGPANVMVEPGKTATVKIAANRTPAFQGQVVLRLQQPVGVISVPEELIIPANQDSIDWPITIPADVTPRRLSIRFQSFGLVGKYEEELNEPVINIDIMKPKS